MLKIDMVQLMWKNEYYENTGVKSHVEIIISFFLFQDQTLWRQRQVVYEKTKGHPESFLPRRENEGVY